MSYLTITKFLNLISKHYLLPCNLDRSKKVAASFCPILCALRSHEFRRSAIGHSPCKALKQDQTKYSRSMHKKGQGSESDKIPHDTTQVSFKFEYVIGLHVFQLGNNWMKDIPRTAKIGLLVTRYLYIKQVPRERGTFFKAEVP